MKSIAILILALNLVWALASPSPTEQKSLPEHLSGEHDPQFDHEAFLGKSESDRFDRLSPEEARKRLGLIVDKIDTSKDGFVSEKELEDWIRHVGKRYVLDDVVRLGAHYDRDGDNIITLEEMYTGAFGNTEDENESKIYDTRYGHTVKQAKERKLKMFTAADMDGDKTLNRDEFADFLHPEDAPHMEAVMVEDRMMDMDLNRDGYVSLPEYINYVWPASEREAGEPEWLPREKEHFTNHRDVDRDGRLSLEELKQWLVPEYDLSNAEAVHLIHHADSNSDMKLSKEEILEHQDVFVGSRATDWGKFLSKQEF